MCPTCDAALATWLAGLGDAERERFRLGLRVYGDLLPLLILLRFWHAAGHRGQFYRP